MRGLNNAGFTLIELGIVILLLATLTGVASGVWVHLRDQLLLDTSSRQFVSALKALRRRAVTGNLSLQVSISPDGKGYGFGQRDAEPDQWHQMPPLVRFSQSPNQPVVFYSRGAAVPSGSYILSSQAGSTKIVISAAGRVRWEWL